MKALINEYVDHIKFGRGMIVGEDTGRISVEFTKPAETKMFQLPEAFEQFLKFEDSSLQDECLLLIQNKKQQKAEELEQRRLEQKKIEDELLVEELEKKKKYKKSVKVKTTKVKKKVVEKDSEEEEADE